MTVIWAREALTAEGWARDVRVTVADGRIASVKPDAAPEGQRVELLIPAPANLHSHAFQRAIAGLTERRGPGGKDSFWTWRGVMYRFLDRLTPEMVQAISAYVQMLMLKAGYGSVGEFHYVHHQPGGTPYDDIAELSARVAAAAEESGIGLTLLPVLYQVGGCDGRALVGGQLRFGNDAERFGRLMDGAGNALGDRPDARLGVAAHSLRAVPREVLGDVAGMTEGPVHLHLAEQVAEVDEVQAAWGLRPVEWVLENLSPDARWCFIHCTQMTPAETEGLAKTGAVAGLCPNTESNLGDGIFDGVRWMEAGGAVGVGSDSNVRISLAEELRVLEYSQRLRDRSRAALAADSKSVGRHLLEAVARGGAQALGRGRGMIAVGEWADLAGLSTDAAEFEGLSGDTALDTFVFVTGDAAVREVWSAGRHMVQAGQHIAEGPITERYRNVLAELRAEM